jgi:hypothetical protein
MMNCGREHKAPYLAYYPRVGLDIGGIHLVSADFALVVDTALENPVFAVDDYYENLKLK